jgi:hypothetical protein
MAKKRTTCPECGHRFIAGHPIKSYGVRSKQSGKGQFNYEITVPEEMCEGGRIPTAKSDALLASIFSLCVGVTASSIVSSFLPASLSDDVFSTAVAQTALIWTGIGGIISYGWLCAEHNQRLKRVLPSFIEQKNNWAAAKDEAIGGNVSLSQDHRYRDGNTESGRTIQYFGALPVDVERFSEWTTAVLGNDTVPAESLAIANWTGSGKLFSRKEYEELLGLLRKSGTVTNQPGRGNILTGGGRRALRQHLKAHSPAPVESMHNG